jgi:hypothetical protein
MLKPSAVAPSAALMACLILSPDCSYAQQGVKTGDMKSLAMDDFGKPGAVWFDPKSCARPSGADLYIVLGVSTLKIPRAAVRGAVPGKIDRMTQDPSGKLTMQVARNAGCAEKPVSYSSVSLSPVSSVEAGAIVISTSPEDRRTLDTQLAKIRDSGSCPSIEPGLIYCEGSRTVGGTKERVGYLMAADTKLVQKSEGPLRARCLFRGDKPFCNVLDDVDGGVRYELPVVGKPTLEQIKLTHERARAFVDSIRVKAKP